MSRLLSAAVAAIVLAAPTYAFACGGFFCSAPVGPVPPEPVDQTAERIIFEVPGDGTITAHVQISYAGPADEFAWIVPVPSTPDVAEAEAGVFQEVETATALQVLLPQPEQFCASPTGGGSSGCSGVGCGAADFGSTAGVEQASDRSAPPVVTVHASGSTDNYDYVSISADLASDLTDWLQVEGYNVSDNMIPVMQPYVDAGMQYLAVRLRDGRTATDVSPLSMTYEGNEPMIPIQLTAVAAQPLMGIQVWIFGETPYLPTNYAWEAPDNATILSDELGNTSYFAWVARVAAEAGGQLWSTEFIGENVTGRFPQHQIVSRFYTRMNPEHMTVDPMFAAASSAPVISNLLDLSAQPTPFGCNGTNFDVLPSLCAYNYCGEDASCGVVEGQVACKCAEGDVAQTITNPDGTDGVTCVPAENPFGISAAAGGAGTEFDPCNDVECGDGACVLRNGFPTCDCAGDAFACLEDDGTVLCVEPAEPPTTFGPGAGAESAPIASAKVIETPNVRFAGLPWLPGAMILGLIVATRRKG